MLPAFLTTIFYAISSVCGARSARMVGGTEANFWRLVLATMFLAVWAYVFGTGLVGAALPVFFVSGVIGIGVGDIAYFQGLPRLGPRLSLLLTHCLTAPIGAAIAWVWLGETLTTGQVLCGAMILVGIGISLAPGKHIQLAKKDVVPGLLWSLLSAAGGAYGAVLSRKAFAVTADAGEVIDAGTGAFQRVVGGLLVAGLCLLVVKWRAVHGHLTRSEESVAMPSKEKWRRAGPWILANSLAGQTIGGSCALWAFHTTKAGIVLPILAVTPLIAIPFTMMIDGERPSMRSLFGDVIAVAGVVALAMQGRH